MNKFVNNKKSKKFILVLVLLILFNFMYPKNVKASLGDDIIAAPAKVFWLMESGILTIVNNWFVNDDLESEFDGAIKIYLTPENIIKGKFIIFNANIFKDVKQLKNEKKQSDPATNNNEPIFYDDELNAVTNGKDALRTTIASWYYAIRNFTIVGLLIVLVYVGIRMAISTIAQDKAKYKSMLKDWFIALCLVVFLHYFMITILNVTDLIMDTIGITGANSQTQALIQDISTVLSDDERVDDEPYTALSVTGKRITLGDAYAKLIVLLAVIYFTIAFMIKYLKREFTIVFLIILGPLSCITYPIDKIGDGKAQAYNKWFHEFFVQVIIQPFHLLLYIVLIGASAELANANIFYSIACFAIMFTAEKFVKEMFGINERLGSPLGDMMKFSAGKKALEMLTKSRGSKGGSAPDNNPENNTISTRDVDNNNLIGEQNRTNLDSGEGTEESNQNAQLQAANEDNNLEENNTTGIGDGEENNANSSIEDNESNGIGNGENNESGDSSSSESNNAGNQPGMLDRFRGRLNTRTVQKYGTTNKKKIWKRRLIKGAGKIAKGTGVALLGTIGTTWALAAGHGQEAAAIFGSAAGYFGRRSRKNNKRSSWSS